MIVEVVRTLALGILVPLLLGLCLDVLTPCSARAEAPATLAVTTFTAGSATTGIAIAGDHIWVANTHEQRLTKLRISDGAIVGGAFIGGFPQALAFDGADLWVPDTSNVGVVRVRESDGTVLSRTRGFEEPIDVVVVGSDIWVADRTSRVDTTQPCCVKVFDASNSAVRMRRSDGAMLSRLAGGAGPRSIISDGDNVWIASAYSATVGAVTAIRAADGAVVRSFPVGGVPWGIAFDGNSIWVANYLDNTITKLRASDGVLLGVFPVGGGPIGVLFDGSSLWVANSRANTVMEVRPSDGAILGVAQVASPYRLAFDGVSIWVTGGSGLSRIERRVVELTVALGGRGAGHVKSLSGGIDCPEDCSESHPSGSTVTLIAAPAWDSAFVGWVGDDACTTGSVALNADTSCTAVFEPAFRDVRRPADINLGSDLGGTGYRALNFTGSAGSGGDTWVTLYDETFDVPTRTIFEGSVQLAADVLVHQFNNSKGAGLLALYSEAPGKKGLVLLLLDSGNSDSIVLATIDRMGKLTRLKSASLGGKIVRNEWYRLTMDLTVVGGTFSVVGRVFRHAIPVEPDSALGVQVGSLTAGTTSLSANGLEASGEVGVVAAATSATVDSSVTNFVVSQ